MSPKRVLIGGYRPSARRQDHRLSRTAPSVRTARRSRAHGATGPKTSWPPRAPPRRPSATRSRPWSGCGCAACRSPPRPWWRPSTHRDSWQAVFHHPGRHRRFDGARVPDGGGDGRDEGPGLGVRKSRPGTLRRAGPSYGVGAGGQSASRHLTTTRSMSSRVRGSSQDGSSAYRSAWIATSSSSLAV